MSKSGIDTRSGLRKRSNSSVVAQRIEVGDAERVGDQRAGAGAAARAHRHAVVLGPVDEVGDDQEVAGEAHLHDGRRSRIRVAPRSRGASRRAPRRPDRAPRGGARGPRRPRARRYSSMRHAVGRGKVGQVALAERDREVAALRDLHRVRERLGQVGEQRGHLGLRLEVLRRA